MNNQNIIFFDGECILCNGFVDFLIRVDKKNNLKFASLQGITAKNNLSSEYIEECDSIVFKNNQNEIFITSQAILNILKSLGGFWHVFQIFNIIPSFIRDFIYRKIANNRYSWFGKRDTCRLPTHEEKEKILP